MQENKKKQKTRIAVSSTENHLESDIDPRFGRCSYFMIIEIEEGKMKHAKAVENTVVNQAGGAGVSAAQKVADHEVDAVISKNFGPRAFDVFTQLRIRMYTARGKVKEAVKMFIDGELEEVSSATGPQHMGMS